MISDNLTIIRHQIAEAARRSGRNPATIKLVAVSKTITAEQIESAVASGQTIFGENYLQEAAEKIARFGQNLSWHFIGHLQSNKTKTAAELFQMIETVERFKIASSLNSHAQRLGKILDILIQVNIGREKQKSGALPEEVAQLLHDIQHMENLRPRGLMAIPPFSPHPERTRPYFKELRQLADRLREQGLFRDETVELSMGMSADFTVAIEEGATLVRVGTAIFGPRILPEREKI